MRRPGSPNGFESVPTLMPRSPRSNIGGANGSPSGTASQRYASSPITVAPTDSAISYTRCASAGGIIAPVGLCGVLTMITRVRGVIRRSSAFRS